MVIIRIGDVSNKIGSSMHLHLDFIIILQQFEMKFNILRRSLVVREGWRVTFDGIISRSYLRALRNF